MTGVRGTRITESERILGEISGQLATLILKIESQTSILREIEKNSVHGKLTVEDIRSNFSNLVEVLTTITTASPEPASTVWEIENNEKHIEKEAFRKQKQISQLWYRLLNQRREHFWNALKCEKYSETYSQWISMEAPILPRKYLIKEITGEPEEETRLRWDLSLSRFKTDIAIIKNKYSRFKRKYETVDTEINEEISKIATGSIQEKLREIWIQNISKEEEKSRKLWVSKALFLENYANTYGIESTENKPKHRNRKRNNKRRGQNKQGSTNTRAAFSKYQNKTKKPRSRSRSQPRLNKLTEDNKGRRTRSNSSKSPRRVQRLYSDVVKNGPQKHQPQNSQTHKTKGHDDSERKPHVSRPNFQRSNNRNSNQRRIHFLLSGQQTPEKDQEKQNTIPKEIIE